MPPDVVDRQLVEDVYALAAYVDITEQNQQAGGE